MGVLKLDCIPERTGHKGDLRSSALGLFPKAENVGLYS